MSKTTNKNAPIICCRRRERSISHQWQEPVVPLPQSQHVQLPSLQHRQTAALGSYRSVAFMQQAHNNQYSTAAYVLDYTSNTVVKHSTCKCLCCCWTFLGMGHISATIVPLIISAMGRQFVLVPIRPVTETVSARFAGAKTVALICPIMSKVWAFGLTGYIAAKAITLARWLLLNSTASTDNVYCIW